MTDSPAAPPIREHAVAVEGDRVVNVRERLPIGPGGGRTGDSAEAGRTPFLLVHGLASNARLWDGVSAHLAAAGHRCVAVDQRGHGRSDRAGDGYGYPQVTGDLVALCDRMDLVRPVLVGQSWGGNVVLFAGALHPGRWSAIAAVDGGTIRLGQQFADHQTAWEALRPPPLAGRPSAEIRRLMGRAVEGWPDGALEAQMGNFIEHPDGTVSPRLGLADHRQIVEAMVDGDPAGIYSRIDVPVLLLPVRGGAGEWAAQKEAAVTAALSALPDGRVRWFDGAHDIHLQDPAGVADALLTLI